MQNKNRNEKQQEKPNNNVTTERNMFIAKTVKSICNKNCQTYCLDSRRQTAMKNGVKNHLARGHGARHLAVNRRVYAITTI